MNPIRHWRDRRERAAAHFSARANGHPVLPPKCHCWGCRDGLGVWEETQSSLRDAEGRCHICRRTECLYPAGQSCFAEAMGDPSRWAS